jgi:predicted nucleic acid-binding protein
MMPSRTEALLDVNVLIAAIFEDHQDHAKANAFLSSLEHF